MNEEQIKQVAQSTEQAIVDVTQNQLAENVNKLRNKQSSFNNTSLAVLIAGIVFIIVMGLFSYFIVAATNSNSNQIKDTITESVGTQNAAIMGLAETIENGNADVIAGIDNVQTSITGLQKSVDAVKEQNTKIQNKAESLSQMTANADAKQIRKFEKCMANRYINNPTSNIREDLLWCKHHLK